MNAEKALSFVPDACTLPTAEQPLREAEFRSLLGSAVREIQRSSATSVTLVLDGDPPTEDTARDLAAAAGVNASCAESPECRLPFTVLADTKAGPG